MTNGRERQNGQWTIGDDRSFTTNQGGSWRRQTYGVAQFGLQATAIPEPREYLLVSVLAIGIFISARRSIRFSQSRFAKDS